MKNILLSILFLFSITTFPATSHAQAGLPFGGLVVTEVPCTCSPFMYEIFTPLFIGAFPLPVPTALSIADFPAGTLMFPGYYPVPGSWVLGFYAPLTVVPACWMWTGLWCTPLEVFTDPVFEIGVIEPFTGTSL